MSSRKLGLTLVYHRVGDPPGDPRRELVPALGVSLFSAQLRYLNATYRLVPASELPEAVRRRRRGQRFPVAITFDDDLRSHVDAAAPLLASARAPATFFVCGASLEGPARFWWERLQEAYDGGADLTAIGLAGGEVHEYGRAAEDLSTERREALAADLLRLAGPDPPDAGLRAVDVARLAGQGLEVGFHTLRHDPLPPLDDERLQRALREGRAALEQAAGSPIRVLAYPHGRVDGRVAAAARGAGFEVGFTGRPEAVTPASDAMLLGRLNPSYDSVGDLALRMAWTLVRSLIPSSGGRRRPPAAPQSVE